MSSIWKHAPLNENGYPGKAGVSQDIFRYYVRYHRISKYTYPYTWVSQDIPGYTETTTPKIFILEDNFLMFEYASIPRRRLPAF